MGSSLQVGQLDNALERDCILLSLVFNSTVQQLPVAGGGTEEAVYPCPTQTIQSQIFHGRLQRAKESVDEYAQELRK